MKYPRSIDIQRDHSCNYFTAIVPYASEKNPTKYSKGN